MSSAPYTGGANTAAVVAVITNAIEASGVLVRLAPEEFSNILARQEAPLIVIAEGGLFVTKYKYLTSYKGLAFYAKSKYPLELPFDAEVVSAKRINIPEL